MLGSCRVQEGDLVPPVAEGSSEAVDGDGPPPDLRVVVPPYEQNA